MLLIISVARNLTMLMTRRRSSGRADLRTVQPSRSERRGLFTYRRKETKGFFGHAEQVPGRSGFTSRLRWLSVAATQETRQPRDVRGQVLSVRFEIRDPRTKAANATLGPYTVYVSLRASASSTCPQSLVQEPV